MCSRSISDLDSFCSDRCEEEYQDRSEANAPYSKYAPSRSLCGYCENPVPRGEQFCCTGCSEAAQFFDQEDALSAVLNASTEGRAA